ncbi:GAF and ANTAR domain-containing protein [Antrihabitans cavernicola]|uniref:GAF and ANTAR domain-containing protein n=1 Tax=Antrihabitans cavernicola TaxID=2495913 RepID=A0A5A7S650_9NOCA|nr:GAF and ANTAR domain-containing protein [Spelaeibacter cavernicola]KAA0017652.1 GAF and ANTAR domain-containing protein [Spelaeibacter cavernicola]
MSSHTDRETALVRAFVGMADTLVDDYDVVDVLYQLVQHCVDLLDAAAAGLMFDDQRGGLQVLASSTERTRLLELFQLQADEGPCLDCVRSGEPVLIEDLTAQTQRWPVFAPEAVREGFLSVHAVPLRLRGQTIGALNLFGTTRGPLPEEDLTVARGLADTATIGILQERAISRGEVLTEQLQTALNSRITIEQAKGVLAHAVDLDMEQAFHLLRGHARRTNSRLGDIAYQLVTGHLDPHAVTAASRT